MHPHGGLAPTCRLRAPSCRGFSCAIDQHAQEYLKIVVGSSEAQQTLEALAILVALWLWKQSWALVRSTLEVRADN
eukprot:11764165-Heterocapsa_arctica.AAC.1